MNAPIPSEATKRIALLHALADQSVRVEHLRAAVIEAMAAPGGAFLSDFYEPALGMLDLIDGRIARQAKVYEIQSLEAERELEAEKGYTPHYARLVDRIAAERQTLIAMDWTPAEREKLPA